MEIPKELIKDHMGKDDYKVLGQFIIKRKITDIKMKWHSFLRKRKHEKKL